jgi:nucleoside-diphosphate-sugar epimerase
VKVLVTGASGMLGRHVATTLAARGDEVRVMQRRESGLSRYPNIREHRGDITDPESVAQAVDGVDGVVHLAARVIMHGPRQPFEEANIGGVANMIEASKRAGVQRFVQVSSPSVGHHGASLVGRGADPADPDRAHGNYARTKAAGELLALSADEPGFPVVAIRPHLVWGPGDTQLVGRLMERARAGRLPIVGSGDALIDTTYVDNAADAIVAALDRAEQAHGEALVVSNGEPRTVGDLIRSICRALGVAPPSRRVPYRVAWGAGAVVEGAWAAFGIDRDPPVTRFLAEHLATAHWFDQRKTWELLDWRPAVSIDEGIRRLAEHEQATTAPEPLTA